MWSGFPSVLQAYQTTFLEPISRNETKCKSHIITTLVSGGLTDLSPIRRTQQRAAAIYQALAPLACGGIISRPTVLKKPGQANHKVSAACSKTSHRTQGTEPSSRHNWEMISKLMFSQFVSPLSKVDSIPTSGQLTNRARFSCLRPALTAPYHWLGLQQTLAMMDIL